MLAYILWEDASVAPIPDVIWPSALEFTAGESLHSNNSAFATFEGRVSGNAGDPREGSRRESRQQAVPERSWGQG